MFSGLLERDGVCVYGVRGLIDMSGAGKAEVLPSHTYEWFPAVTQNTSYLYQSYKPV